MLRIDLRSTDKQIQQQRLDSMLKDAPMKKSLKSLYRQPKRPAKPSVVRGEPWTRGVMLRLLEGSEADVVLQLADGETKPKRRPPPMRLSVGTREQRDLLLLATAVRPANSASST